jgi:hypothetical protein
MIQVRNIKTVYSRKFDDTTIEQERFTKIFVEHVADFLANRFKEIGFIVVSEDLVIYILAIFKSKAHFGKFMETLRQIPFTKGSSFKFNDFSVVKGKKIFNMSNIFDIELDIEI